MKYVDFTKNVIYERQCGIYIIYCDKARKKNGVYIGQSRDIHKRWLAHVNDLKNNRHKNKHLQNIYNKYGENSFNFDILELCSPDELNKKEEYYIDYYDSYKHGMNKTLGGEGTHGMVYTEEMRKARSRENSAWWGRKHKEGWYEKILPYVLAVKCKPVVQLDKDTFEVINEYSSVSEASKEMGCSVTAIDRCLNHQCQTSQGYIWLFKESYDNGERPQEIHNTKKKEVYQRDKTTMEIICHYSSIEEAERIMNNNDGKRHSNIIGCLSHKSKTAYGYIWTYEP